MSERFRFLAVCSPSEDGLEQLRSFGKERSPLNGLSMSTFDSLEDGLEEEVVFPGKERPLQEETLDGLPRSEDGLEEVVFNGIRSPFSFFSSTVNGVEALYITGY